MRCPLLTQSGHSDWICAAFKMFVPLCFSEMSQWRPFILPTGDGHVGSDAVTIPDYVAIGLLIGMMLLAAARSLASGNFEL